MSPSPAAESSSHSRLMVRDQPDLPAVACQHRIVGQEDQRFSLGLGDENAIEGIGVDGREGLEGCDVPFAQRQALVASLLTIVKEFDP